MLPVITVGLDQATTEIISATADRRTPPVIVHHCTTAEEATFRLADLAAAGQVETNDGRYGAHVVYGEKVLGVAASRPRDVRVPVSGRRMLAGAVVMPEQKPRRVVDGAIMGEDDQTIWMQAATALHCHMLFNLAEQAQDDQGLRAIDIFWQQLAAVEV